MNYSSPWSTCRKYTYMKLMRVLGKRILDMHNARRNGKYMSHNHNLEEKYASHFLTFNMPSIHHLTYGTRSSLQARLILISFGKSKKQIQIKTLNFLLRCDHCSQ